MDARIFIDIRLQEKEVQVVTKIIAGKDEKVPSPFLGAKITTDQKQRLVD